jgi:type VI secretion system protein ImpA
MAVLDVASLLAPISGDAPCGENLEYDAAYVALETAARGKPEQVYGDKVFAAEEPDWRQIERSALELLRRTADLRLVVYLARALLRTSGFPGFADALSLMRGLLEQQWTHVFPQLEEDDDATLRVNVIAAIAQVPQQGDEETVLRAVRLAPLVEAPRAGRFNLRDCQIASGKLAALPGVLAATEDDIKAAFDETPPEMLRQTAEAVRCSITMTEAIENLLTERVGAAQAVDLSPLVAVLQEAEKIIGEQLKRRGVEPPSEALPVSGLVQEPVGESVRTGNGAAARQQFAGDITSREEVVRLLDLACEYFHRYEPSSPVPLLLERAKRLVAKDFIEILRDLAPDGIAQFEVVSGINRENGA